MWPISRTSAHRFRRGIGHIRVIYVAYFLAEHDSVAPKLRNRPHNRQIRRYQTFGMRFGEGKTAFEAPRLRSLSHADFRRRWQGQLQHGGAAQPALGQRPRNAEGPLSVTAQAAQRRPSRYVAGD